ncbi:unnamed protein product [Anisakis simplex]|uniref:UPF0505 protein C16orf62 (inferred by orthology to a human protein) n=1 Tax=Anisakis simplex TaxID=6269 RepID=A0A0M3K4N0_ANISI|nr:unnamed protein product [Anisakis simplex]
MTTEKQHPMLFDDSTLIWKWKCRRRNWDKEMINSEEWGGVEVLVDPLRANSRRSRHLDTQQKQHLIRRTSPEIVIKTETDDGTEPEFLDPLGAYREEQSETNPTTKIDPLSVQSDKAEPQLPNTLAIEEEEYLAKETILPGFEPWSTHRRRILQEFTTNEKLSITSSFLPNGVPLSTKIVIADRAAHRLEQLNDTSGLKKLADLSQEEYVRNVNELRKRLLIAWANEKKVESVQIIVELSRILSSTAAPQFYPSQFVLVTDILDIFGDLVYERLFNKANKERSEAAAGSLPKHFTHTDVPLTTRETAKNWFCKIQEILELLPRFYVETSIIGCIRFLDTDSLAANLHRLCGMTLSIQHPLIASYARSYICRVAMRLLPADRAPHWKCLNDWMQSFETQPQFPSLIDLFRNNSASYQQCANAILSAFVRQHPMRFSSNFQFANQMLQLCKVMHDSLSTSSTDQDVRMVSLLIERALDRFDFDSDPERAIDFFVDCRAALSNIDSLVAWCVSRVCALGYTLVERRSQSRSVSSFTRALIANAFITIASLSNPLHKLQLYLQTALLTLLVNSLPQMDAIMKCCIEVLASCQAVPVQEYRRMTSSFLAFLVFVPDSPKKAPLYMFNAFMNATARYPWGDEVLERARLFIDCLRYLSSVCQAELPYHIGNSQSNDTIYGSSAAFLDVIDEKCDTVIGQLEELYNGDTSKSVILALELLEFIVDFGDIKVVSE